MTPATTLSNSYTVGFRECVEGTRTRRPHGLVMAGRPEPRRRWRGVQPEVVLVWAEGGVGVIKSAWVDQATRQVARMAIRMKSK